MFWVFGAGGLDYCHTLEIPLVFLILPRKTDKKKKKIFGS